MIRRPFVFVAAAMLSILGSSALADAYHSMTLTKTANPVIPSYPGTSLDILGVKPGMSFDSTETALNAFYSKKPGANDNFGSRGSYKGIELKSQDWEHSLSDEKSTDSTVDSIQVTFSAPTTGVTVVAVERDIRFKTEKSQPTVQQILSALDKKYGSESTPTRMKGSYIEYVNWLFGDKGHVNQIPKSLVLDNGALECQAQFIENAALTYKNNVSSNEYFCVSARMLLSVNDTNRVKELHVTIASPIDMLISAQAEPEQFQAAGIAALNHEVPGTLPKL